MLPVSCWHCENPVCVDAANGAMYKEEKYGAVLIDPDKATSTDLRKANEACPYGAISFESDAPNAKAFMCTMCIDKLEAGEKPVCVMGCSMRALDFDTMENLQKKYGTNRDLTDLPDSNIAMPAVIFKPRHVRKLHIPYDANKAIELWAKRDPLPPVFSSKADLEVPPGISRHEKLNLKPKNIAELNLAVMDCE